MNSTLTDSYRPTGEILGLDRFEPQDVPEQDGSFSAIVHWDQVNQVVHTSLARMAERVRQRHEGIRSQAGRTSARAFCLFAYRVFQSPLEACDAVVVGVNFEPLATGFRARGEVCGEESGRVFYESAERSVSGTPAAVLAAAYEIASELAKQVDVVTSALLNCSSPSV